MSGPRARFEAAILRIADEDLAAAQRQFAEVETQTNRLAVHPEMGRPGRQSGTRLLSIARTPFLIAYRIRPRAERIEVFRFIHTSQNWQV